MSLSLVTANFEADLEAAVLSALLTDVAFAMPECVGAGLKHSDFADRRHQLVYGAIQRMHAAALKVDALTVSAWLDRHHCLEAVGGKDYLAYLLDASPSVNNVRSHAAMVRQAKRGTSDAVARAEQDVQVGEALAFLDLNADAFLRYPFTALDRALGGLAPGRPHWFAAHTGTGKSSLVNTLAKHWGIVEHKRCAIAGLEAAANELRTMLACRVLGIDHGELFKGNLQRLSGWADLRAVLKAEIARQRTDDAYTEHFRFSPFERLTADNTRAICEQAAEWGADVLFIDHVDHMDTTHNGGRERAESLAIVQVLNALTKSYGLRAIVTSQTNREGKAANPMRDHYPLGGEMIRHGDHKMQEAGAFCGLRRPIKRDVTTDELSDARRDRSKIPGILAPNTMAVNVMKDRYGHAAGDDIWLGFWRGEVCDDPGSAHGISTRRAFA